MGCQCGEPDPGPLNSNACKFPWWQERGWWSCQTVTCGNTLTVFKIYLKGLAHILITHLPTNDLWKMELRAHLYSGGVVVMSPFQDGGCFREVLKQLTMPAWAARVPCATDVWSGILIVLLVSINQLTKKKIAKNQLHGGVHLLCDSPTYTKRRHLDPLKRLSLFGNSMSSA
jgi:hypothetical protein